MWTLWILLETELKLSCRFVKKGEQIFSCLSSKGLIISTYLFFSLNVIPTYLTDVFSMSFFFSIPYRTLCWHFVNYIRVFCRNFITTKKKKNNAMQRGLFCVHRFYTKDDWWFFKPDVELKVYQQIFSHLAII